MVTKIRKTSMLPKIRDDAIILLFAVRKRGSRRYADYTKQFYHFLRRYRQALTDYFQCVRSINDMGHFSLRLKLSSTFHKQKGFIMPLVEHVELKLFLNDPTSDSLHVGRARIAPTPIDSPRDNLPAKKRLLGTPDAEGVKRLRGEGVGRGRGHGN
jgi:hypothetical protein